VRVAAIDIGTNSVHLVVADVGPDGSIVVVEKSRQQVELGRGGLTRQRIAPEAMERAIVALEGFARATELLGVDAITAAATSAVREAENGAEFCDRVKEATGIHVKIISGVGEARLIWRGARPALDPSRSPALLIDIGGGSVEMIVAEPERMITAYSLPLGHLRTTEQYVSTDPPAADEIQAIRKRVRALCKPVLEDPRTRNVQAVIGTSGSIRTLARMATLMRGDPLTPHDHGLVLDRSELKKLLHQLQELKAARLTELPGMDGRRRNTLPAGAAVVYQLMKSFEIEQLSTSESALREGLLHQWIEHHRPELALTATEPNPRTRSVVALMDRYGVDGPHAEQVCRLALGLLDGLATVHGLDADARDLLGWAARLHDIGHHIDPRDHNRHGEYLILNTPMPGFTAPEVAVLATIVRHHRGSRPKSSHRGYDALSRSDQRKVDVLSAVLRVADALDRSHNQPVRDVAVHIGTDEVVVEVRAHEEAYLERWAAERRKGLLAQVLGRAVRIEVDTDEQPLALRAEASDQVE
jgi:exopolyphosphatase / guanosine-5'-triphosphate,3'-diphosphate pyrophosphatase